MSFDGKDTGEVKKYLAVVAKDSDKKGFYIRIVDKEVYLNHPHLYLYIAHG